jgi:hypothetical protein
MLDVHPPHHAASTWRDFFIHIATIVIGLLIAIGLEQTVEYIHHRHLVAETRKALDEEKQENIRSFHDNVTSHVMAMAFLHNNLRIFEYLREHPSTPQDKLPGILYWPLFSTQPVQAAWTTAQHTDVLSLMPREEVSKVAATYAALDYAWQAYQPVIASLTLSTGYYTQTPTTRRPPTLPGSLLQTSTPRSPPSGRPSRSRPSTATRFRLSAGNYLSSVPFPPGGR